MSRFTEAFGRGENGPGTIQRSVADRTILTVLVIVAVVAAVLIGIGAWLVSANVSTPRPTLTAYSDGTAVTVHPVRYCEQALRCDRGGSPAVLNVRQDPVQLSVPKDVSSNSWVLESTYIDPAAPRGAATHTTVYTANSRNAVTIPAYGALGGRLARVEVRLPERLPNGKVADRAVWALDVPLVHR